MRASIKGGFWALVLCGAGLGWLSVTAGPPETDPTPAVAALGTEQQEAGQQEVLPVEETAASIPEVVEEASVADTPAVQDTAEETQPQITAEPAPEPEEITPVVVADATPQPVVEPPVEEVPLVVPAEEGNALTETPAPAPMPQAPDAPAPVVAVEIQEGAPDQPDLAQEPALSQEPAASEDPDVAVAIEDSAPAQDDLIAQLQAQAEAEPAPEVITQPAPAPQANAAPAPVIIVPLPQENEQQEVVIAQAPQQEESTPPAPAARAAPQSNLPRVNQLLVTEPETTEEEAPETTLADVAIPQDAPAIMRHAAMFENPEGLPVVGFVLIDDGTMTNGPLTLFESGFTATVVLDALMEDVGLFSEAYIAAGMEVAMDVPLPQGATPSDVEVAFSVALEELPQAALLYSDGEGALRGNTDAAEQAMAVLAADGRGLVTIPRGLGGLVRTAEQLNVPVSTVTRNLDDADGDMRVMLRTLDRVAFNARQTGGAVVLARMHPETMGLLRDWAATAPGKGVMIGPASALMVDKTAYLTDLAQRQAEEEAAAAQEAQAAEEEEAAGGAFGVLPTISQ